MENSHHIVIAGAGPAGAIAALGLARLNYQVTVITKPRGFDCCEGISERVVQAFVTQAAHHALQVIPTPSPRSVHWNGAHSMANTERLVSRQALDRALQKDMNDAGIGVIEGQLVSWRESSDNVDIVFQTKADQQQTLSGDFFVDARGRSASAKGQARLKGPETLSLLLKWQAAPGRQQSMAASLQDGWAWLARLDSGECYTQVTLSSADRQLPAKDHLEEFVLGQLRQVTGFEAFVADAHIGGAVTARSSTAILNCDPVTERSLRIGDAAMAVDPLSGNGIFQSLSTALSAPAVINTILNRPADKHVAQQFYRERVNHSFMRFARMGRDFYRLEHQWPNSGFWQQRTQWPDTHPAHEPIAPDKITIERKAVIHGGFIEATEVVITPDQPLGIWHLDGVELAPLVRELLRRPLQPKESLQERFGTTFSNDIILNQWCQQQGLIESTPRS